MPRASQQAAAAKDHEAPTEADAVMNKPRCGEAPGLVDGRWHSYR
jgi:hypothetical protein